MAGLSGERLVNILIVYSDPFPDTDDSELHIELTDVPECDALSVALGAAKVHGYTQYFDIVIRRTTDGTKFNYGYYDARYAKSDGVLYKPGFLSGYRFTHTDFDLDTKED